MILPRPINRSNDYTDLKANSGFIENRDIVDIMQDIKIDDKVENKIKYDSQKSENYKQEQIDRHPHSILCNLTQKNENETQSYFPYDNLSYKLTKISVISKGKGYSKITIKDMLRNVLICCETFESELDKYHLFEITHFNNLPEHKSIFELTSENNNLEILSIQVDM